ncbi:phospholipid/cholesterol/gamma-HCH transport system substrate-binding protein [Kibdelosporangium banguiense]|uniref:Phospholipid/cholesterol/gamma-HCH transport system substrate-binding protein n=1 Tax=Kibdelosporangium banguiense TaxID=1365924 RepID=A0ABS4TM72_9PSEU|nr:MlaD family protein [Kibdelosporangium banguiense]MBP2325500.1 phospholipid/cholesterol/gamma-HCH transport system substrate-binding protein [Kibdelosporangium banguiense]
MLTRRIKLQVIIFVVIALVGISYVGASYAGLDQLFGGRGMLLKVRMAESGGLFTNAEVTYRGVRVGRVGPMHLTDDGIEVELRMEPDAPEIPVDLDAVVANRSAVGEQYLDLRPRSEKGPYLADGAVITGVRTPMPVHTVLSDLDSLIASVPLDSLRTVVDEMSDAFRGRGEDLQVLLSNQDSFIQTASQYLPQTQKLIDDGGAVLLTQENLGSSIKQFSSDAQLFAEQLRKSDGDLRKLITVTPQMSNEISGLIRESGTGVGVVLANLLTPAQVFSTRGAAFEQLLALYPQAVNNGYRVINADGTTNLALTLTFNNPPPCRQGYESTVYRPGNDISPAPFNTAARCTLPKGNPSLVRGSQNAPKGGPVPNEPTLVALAPVQSGPTSLTQVLGGGR